MKKYCIVIVLVALIAACGGGSGKKENTAPVAETKDLSANPDYQKGLELIGKSDCFTCHKVSEKNIGPSYQEVAAKYENTDATITMLADKIINGGQGIWGGIPMTPHPQISEDEAKQMVKYVLLLK